MPSNALVAVAQQRVSFKLTQSFPNYLAAFAALHFLFILAYQKVHYVGSGLLHFPNRNIFAAFMQLASNLLPLAHI